MTRENEEGKEVSVLCHLSTVETLGLDAGEPLPEGDAMRSVLAEHVRNKLRDVLSLDDAYLVESLIDSWRVIEARPDEMPCGHGATGLPPTNDEYREAARKRYASEGSVEIDEEAPVSRGDDPGAYVQAWVWVYDEDVDAAAKETD